MASASAKQKKESGSGELWCLDIQETATKKTHERLSGFLSPEEMTRVRVRQQSHKSLPPEIQERSVGIITYNLGWLPGSDKRVVTLPESTSSSLQAAAPLVRPGGAIVVTCYRDRREAREETETAIREMSKLDESKWNVVLHDHLNRANGACVISALRRFGES
uniref:Uncharacterized protein n=1 Tax=Chromera velia CCMP2878 TaxID=1169474 RepID=A0A0G4HY64_9ALVE|mmetsp:Transcript_11453/g.22054  ORF Transcript_11453/g.22054 Transcript_11453/m.22054 type:complete len:163 (+) Transcript_11453:2037-2525(+)|eukprot:Cvel_33431.t1-p1 / transcript=Cvel_33431.t1 / gene=Cvel_33431 / organism=Chromera_velia_CCMP2878 / gene_product=Putative rRNA methylase YtqB, putative / transcript_product=Putative rRNA methylase YtqB, putative / location=Cvel_scaffold5427:2447-4542(-) / protein_length=162 / sequence_SO=supercontig / SO=protein_coding / is_pseudo=false